MRGDNFVGVETNRERFLWDVREISRAIGDRPEDIAAAVAAMVAATYLCPHDSEGEPGFLNDSDELTNARWLGLLNRLSRLWSELGSQQRDPFEAAKRVQSWPPGALERLKRLVVSSQWEATERRRHTVPAWLGQALIELAGSWGSPFRGGASKLPSLILDVIRNNLEVEASTERSIYCGYDSAADVAIELAAAGKAVDFDLQSATLAAICQCISFAENLTLRVRFGDPMDLAKNDREARGAGPWPSHDIAIVIPPFNDKSRARGVDALGTGLPRPATSEAIGVTVALARGRELAICIVSHSFLFQASKSNQVFKQYAISDYYLDAVVSFSTTLLQTLALPTGLLLFKPLAGRTREPPSSRTILMVAAREERGRFAARPGLTDGVGKLIRERELTAHTTLVGVSEIAANDFVIQPERYVESLEAQRLRELEASSTLVALEDLAEFLRPQAVRKAQDEESVASTYFEVAVADLDEVGRVRHPTKQVSVSRDAVIQTRRALLKLGDIILVIKGSVGKVGFVCDLLDDGEANWIASQSFVIIRLRPHAPIRDPRVLFRYLSSPLGTAKLQNLSVGATVPGLQMASLQRLSVAVPSPEEQTEIGLGVDELFAIQDQIDELRAKLTERQHAIWPSN
jgi:type I restriction enzyme M protein